MTDGNRIARRMGRPSSYSPEIAEEVCNRIASGRAVSDVGADEDMPSANTMFDWCDSHEYFRRNFLRARDIRSEAIASTIQGLAVRVVDELTLDPYRVRIAVDAHAKAEAIMRPRAEKVTKVEFSGAVGVTEISRDDLARRLAYLLMQSSSAVPALTIEARANMREAA